MDVIAALDQMRAQVNVLEHPFYERWSAGELSFQELDAYATEYRHAVVALAHASSDAAACASSEHNPTLRLHAEEEHAHVTLWDRFADRARADAAAQLGEVPLGAGTHVHLTGASPAACEPLESTRTCVNAWQAGEDLLERLAVLYVLEAGQPAISETKLDGLHHHYGYREGSPATGYFTTHAARDHEHAREAASLIERLLGDGTTEDGVAHKIRAMLARARAALEGNWTLLDGVHERFAA